MGLSTSQRLGAGLIALAALALTPGLAAAGTLDTVKQAKTIRLAVRDDAPPFSYKGKDGQPAGYMVDLCRAVAKHLSADLSLGDLTIAYVPVTAADRFDAIANGKADLLCEPTTETLARRAKVDFSIPTFIDGASVMLKGADPVPFESLAGKKIGVLAGTTTEQELRDTLAAANLKADVVLTKSHEEGLAMLKAGDVAAYFGDRAILSYLVGVNPADNLRVADQYLSVEPYALALARGDTDFRLAVDRALSHIYKSAEIGAVFSATFGANVAPPDMLKSVYVTSALPE